MLRLALRWMLVMGLAAGTALVACGVEPEEAPPPDGGPMNTTADAGPADGGLDGGTPAVPTNPLVFAVTIVPDPARLGRNVLSVIIRGTNGVPVPNANLSVGVFMPAMGHGSSETPVVTVNGAGEYTVEHVTFTMQGTWRVTLTATAGDLSGTTVLNYGVN